MPPADLPLALTDAGALRRVTSNLIGNALKYTPTAGEIGISARREGRRIVLEVCDDGCSIRAEDVPRVFEKFYRGQPLDAGCEAQTKTNSASEDRVVGSSSGVGLGLYLVRNSVEQIKGEIMVESPVDKNGRGTRFTIFLPIAS
jgi:signal transduction histidine kinase